MSKLLLTSIICISFQPVFSQMVGAELLKKTIEYHDPNGNWESLNAKFFLEESRPNRPSRTSEMILKNDLSYFQLIGQTEGGEILREVQNNTGRATVNGSEEFSNEISDKYRLSNDRILRTRNYYVYLYGLPMKLTDPGTNIRNEVKEVLFDNSNYLELAVTYDQEVGSDDWFFYINPTTYEMKGYKFLHKNGKGEFITIEGLSTINSIKIPKLREWYTTEDSTLLGVDNLAKVESLR